MLRVYESFFIKRKIGPWPWTVFIRVFRRLEHALGDRKSLEYARGVHPMIFNVTYVMLTSKNLNILWIYVFIRLQSQVVVLGYLFFWKFRVCFKQIPTFKVTFEGFFIKIKWNQKTTREKPKNEKVCLGVCRILGHISGLFFGQN